MFLLDWRIYFYKRQHGVFEIAKTRTDTVQIGQRFMNKSQKSTGSSKLEHMTRSHTMFLDDATTFLNPLK